MQKPLRYNVTVEVAAERLARLIDIVLSDGGSVTGVAPLDDMAPVETRTCRGSPLWPEPVQEPEPNDPSPVAAAPEPGIANPGRRRKRMNLTDDVIEQFLPRYSQFKAVRLRRWIIDNGGAPTSTGATLARLIDRNYVRRVKRDVYAVCAAPKDDAIG